MTFQGIDPAAELVGSEDVRALVDIGFIALSYGFDQHAVTIFTGVETLRPSEEAGFLGHALVELRRGNIDVSIKILRALPPSDVARAFLALALLRQGATSEAREILSDVIATGGQTAPAEMARVILQSIDVESQIKLPR